MKLFKITYNDGGWYSGSLPHFYHVAENEEEVIECERYKEYKERAEFRGGTLWITEIKELVGRNGILSEFEFDNLDDYKIYFNIIKERK